MAYTERYVTQAASGGGDGSSGTPWTLAEALTNAVAGDRVNVQSDAGYSLGADTVSNAGAFTAFIVFRGYDATIGDLENQGRNAADGTLDTTGFPVITLTGTLTPNLYVVFQNLAFTASLSFKLMTSSTIDNVTIMSCAMINTKNVSTAGVVDLDNECRLIDSDFECSGADHGQLVYLDANPLIYGCRFKAIAGDGLTAINPTVVGSVFIGDGSSIAINVESRATGPIYVFQNTIYNWGTAIELNGTASYRTSIINNQITDNTKYLDDTNASAVSAIEVNNRTRDNTTPRTSVGDGLLVGEVITDTGGPETDYTDESTDDLSLIAAAPGIDAGMGFGS